MDNASLLYFAYGNNMRERTMRERVGEAHYRFLSLARLDGFRLTFTTTTPEWGGPVADLTASNEDAVYGVLYRVERQAWDALAPHEPTYGRLQSPVARYPEPQDLTPSPIEATLYFVAEQHKEPERPAEPRYLARILGAAEERGLPRDYIDALRATGEGRT